MEICHIIDKEYYHYDSDLENSSFNIIILI